MRRGVLAILSGTHLPKLHVRHVVPLYRVSLSEGSCCCFVILEIQLAKAFVVPNLPVLNADPLRLVIDIDGLFMFPQQVTVLCTYSCVSTMLNAD
jgi:hypothetical protein